LLAASGKAISIGGGQESIRETFEYSVRHAGFCNRVAAVENHDALEAFDFRPGAEGGVIPDNLQRIPMIFSPSSNRVE